ncbi:RNA polymerase sigma factor [Sphingomonas sp. RHCKR47]|uniref:RNA polymerase sigma factor n=1 Tax=Sphingomonas citricola TaxID=2862498 RepID=UPI001C66ACF2|nr:RNA polymerase sigma factor [Sphingomonas citricola]MBW6524386.1 RNA polymerase sigma factor [Sphingomonas citricola]
MKRGAGVVSSAWTRAQRLTAFEHELASVMPRLRRFAHGLSRDATDADDLLQATAERMLRARAQWEPGTNFVAWSYRIMRNLWVDTARARQRHTSVLAPEEEGLAIGMSGAAEASVELGYLMRAMERLPDEQREAVALVMIEGLGYAEAAGVLDIPAGTLTSRLVRGRQALRAMLENAS